MGIKRDIRGELKNQSKKEMIANVKQIVKYLLSIDKLKISVIFINRLLLTFQPIALLFVFQNLINYAVSGYFNTDLIILLGILQIVKVLLIYFRQLIETEYENLVYYKSSTDLRKKISELKIKDIENKELHNNYNRAATATRLFAYYYRTVMLVIFGVISIISYFIILLIYNYMMILVAFLILSFFFYRKFMVLRENFIKRWEFAEKRRKINYYNMILSADIYINETKMLAVDKDYYNLYKNANKELCDLEIKLQEKIVKSNREINFSNQILSIIFIAYLLYDVVNFGLLIGNFNTYRTAFSSFTLEIEQILSRIVDFQVDALEMREFFEFMNFKNNYEDGILELKEVKTIEFKDVYFRYKEDLDYVLNGVSFKLEKGKNVALIGENGSGKTTVMKLIEKVYEPTKGEILINDINIKKYNTKSIRKNISMLLQEYVMYQESIRENILVKENKNLSDEDVLSKIGDKSLVNKIKKMPDGINTVLGNWFGEGIKLSKGQMQKIALARVFSRNSSFLLLDEPNSALDPKSEREMFDYINKSKKKKTALITLHVFTNIDSMDSVMMFEEGKIIAEGSHKEIYGINKKYTDFYNLQEREEKLKKV